MGLYQWRFRISLAASQQLSSSPLSPNSLSRSVHALSDANGLSLGIRGRRTEDQFADSGYDAASERRMPALAE